MNLIDFEQIGGYRLKQTTFAKIQEAYFEILKAQIGHLGIADVGNFIISGCEIVGLNITSGLMYIDGELCPFETVLGDANTKIKKEIELNDLDFADGLPKSVFRKTTAVVDAVNGVALSVFVKVPKVNELVNELTDWGDIQNIPRVVIDPANLTLTPPEKTVLQRLDLLEAQNKIFQTGGGIFHWGKAIADIPPGFAPIANMESRILVNIDRRTDALGQYVNPEFSPLSGDMPGKKSGTKTNVLDIENIPEHDHEVGFYAIDLASSNDGSNQELIAGPTTANKVKTTKTGGRLVNGIRETKPFSIVPLVQTCEFIQWVGLP